MIYISGVANVLITNPLWVVNSRIKMQGVHKLGKGSPTDLEYSQRKYKGLLGNNDVPFSVFEVYSFSCDILTMFNHNIHLIYYNFYLDGLIQIGYHEGVSNVWAGTIPSLVLVSQPTIKFTVYEFLKRYYLQLYGKTISRVILAGLGCFNI